MGEDSGTRVAVRVVVRGQVQGVGFRWSAQQRAGELGVVGWVRNETDGSVAAHLEGAPDAVRAMLAWCHEGPRSAHVSDVDQHDADLEGTATTLDVRG